MILEAIGVAGGVLFSIVCVPWLCYKYYQYRDFHKVDPGHKAFAVLKAEYEDYYKSPTKSRDLHLENLFPKANIIYQQKVLEYNKYKKALEIKDTTVKNFHYSGYVYYALELALLLKNNDYLDDNNCQYTKASLEFYIDQIADFFKKYNKVADLEKNFFKNLDDSDMLGLDRLEHCCLE